MGIVLSLSVRGASCACLIMKALRRPIITSELSDTCGRRIDEEITRWRLSQDLLGLERLIRNCDGKHVVRALSGSHELH